MEYIIYYNYTVFLIICKLARNIVYITNFRFVSTRPVSLVTFKAEKRGLYQTDDVTKEKSVLEAKTVIYYIGRKQFT